MKNHVFLQHQRKWQKMHFVLMLRKKIINHFSKKKWMFLWRCPIKHKTQKLRLFRIFFLHSYKMHFQPFVVFSHGHALIFSKHNFLLLSSLKSDLYFPNRFLIGSKVHNTGFLLFLTFLAHSSEMHNFP